MAEGCDLILHGCWAWLVINNLRWWSCYTDKSY